MRAWYKFEVLLFLAIATVDEATTFPLRSIWQSRSPYLTIQVFTLQTVNEIYKNISSQTNRQFDLIGEIIIKNLMHNSHNQTKLRTQLHSLMDYTAEVNKLYDQMGNFVNGAINETSILEDFAKNVTSHEIASPNAKITYSGILELIAEFLQATQEDMVCSTNQSTQQILLTIYNTIKLTDIKSYMIVIYSYMNLELIQKVNYTQKAQIMNTSYKQRTLEYDEAIKKVMQKNSGELWKCDPSELISGTTYIEVSQLPESSDKDKHSDRYFNMRPVIADVQENKVVTGLRFTKHNHIIYLQIQEGKLLQQGRIEENSIRWVPVEEYDIAGGQEGKDFYALSASQRSIDLNVLKANDGYLLTGVRFGKIGNHLNFEIYITPFNFETGKLLDPIHHSIWKQNSDDKAELSKPNPHIDFTNINETTVPFLDAQPVAAVGPVPLEGAGLYHKVGKNLREFIALKIVTCDVSHYFVLPTEKDQ